MPGVRAPPRLCCEGEGRPSYPHVESFTAIASRTSRASRISTVDGKARKNKGENFNKKGDSTLSSSRWLDARSVSS